VTLTDIGPFANDRVQISKYTISAIRNRLSGNGFETVLTGKHSSYPVGEKR